MKVYVIRHGQSEANRQGRHGGWGDLPLSELGRRQAAAAGQYLRGVDFGRVYCSDLLRARETAALALPGCRPVYSPLLREINVGELTGREWLACDAAYGEAHRLAEKHQDFSAFGGETAGEMAERLGEFYEALEQLEGVEQVAVFGHVGTVRQLLCRTVGCEVLLEHLGIDNGSVSLFSYEEGCWKLQKWNMS